MKDYYLPGPLERKITDTLRWLDAALTAETVERPVILWSGGKDSMVLLDLVRYKMDLNLPVVLFREPWWPQKYAFHDTLAAVWNLEVYSPPPLASTAYQAPDHLVLLARYGMRGSDVIEVPKDVIEYDASPTVSWACGVEILERPRGVMEWPWETVLVGHKDCDIDPVLGQVPLKTARHAMPGGTTLLYPLRHWTDADIWDYIEAHDLPMDEARYHVAERRNWADRGANADWFHACTRCLSTPASESVPCPRWQRDIPGRKEGVVWEDTLLRDNFTAPEHKTF